MVFGVGYYKSGKILEKLLSFKNGFLEMAPHESFIIKMEIYHMREILKMVVMMVSITE